MFGQVAQKVYVYKPSPKVWVALKLIRTGDGSDQHPYQCSGGFRRLEETSEGKALSKDTPLTRCHLSSDGVPAEITVSGDLGTEDMTWALFWSDNGKTIQLVGSGCDAGSGYGGTYCIFKLHSK
jgi:hypothetical protein